MTVKRKYDGDLNKNAKQKTTNLEILRLTDAYINNGQQDLNIADVYAYKLDEIYDEIFHKNSVGGLHFICHQLREYVLEFPGYLEQTSHLWYIKLQRILLILLEGQPSETLSFFEKCVCYFLKNSIKEKISFEDHKRNLLHCFLTTMIRCPRAAWWFSHKVSNSDKYCGENVLCDTIVLFCTFLPIQLEEFILLYPEILRALYPLVVDKQKLMGLVQKNGMILNYFTHEDFIRAIHFYTPREDNAPHDLGEFYTFLLDLIENAYTNAPFALFPCLKSVFSRLESKTYKSKFTSLRIKALLDNFPMARYSKRAMICSRYAHKEDQKQGYYVGPWDDVRIVKVVRNKRRIKRNLFEHAKSHGGMDLYFSPLIDYDEDKTQLEYIFFGFSLNQLLLSFELVPISFELISKTRNMNNFDLTMTILSGFPKKTRHMIFNHSLFPILFEQAGIIFSKRVVSKGVSFNWPGDVICFCRE